MTLQLTGIKTNDGYFLSDKPNGDKYTKGLGVIFPLIK